MIWFDRAIDRVLERVARRRGFVLARPTTFMPGWRVSPLKDPHISISWSEPDVPVSRAYARPRAPSWWQE